MELPAVMTGRGSVIIEAARRTDSHNNLPAAVRSPWQEAIYLV
jgi:hypothetical protein